MRKVAIAGLLLAASVLAGCGDAAEGITHAAAPEAPKGIFISAMDCADSGKLTIEECGRAIDKAVAQHEALAPSYKSLRSCVAVEGPDRCVKGVDEEYKLKLQAFFVTMSKPAVAIPLYPSQGGAAGFRSPTKQSINAIDDTYSISVAALTVANENTRLPRRTAE